MGEEEEDIPEIKEPVQDNNQLDFAVRMFKRYLKEHNKTYTYERRVHYWIMKLPQEKRLIPSNKVGVPRVYENTAYNYQRLSQLLVIARIKGLLGWDQVIDNKNPYLYENKTRTDGSSKVVINDLNPFSVDKIELINNQAWKHLLGEVEAESKIETPQFAHQSHYLIIVIEKSTADEELQAIADKYGCDYQVFGGQPSVTREYNAIQRAKQMKFIEDAKKVGKPMAIFYLSDLDPAGMDMPNAYFSRVQELYPHKDHKLIPVVLNREQVDKHNLPSDFTNKKYDKKHIERFIKETGGEKCVELDSMEVEDLVRYVEEAIKPYANLKGDEDKLIEMEAEGEKTTFMENEKIQNYLEEANFKVYIQEYEETEERIEDLNNDINNLNEQIREIQGQRTILKNKFNLQFREALGYNEEVEEKDNSEEETERESENEGEEEESEGDSSKNESESENEEENDSNEPTLTIAECEAKFGPLSHENYSKYLSEGYPVRHEDYKCQLCGKFWEEWTIVYDRIGREDWEDESEESNEIENLGEWNAEEKVWIKDGVKTPGYRLDICQECKAKKEKGMEGQKTP